MAQMTTDAEVLAKEAGNFERIAGELKDTIARVEQAANELGSNWQGAAAKAAQSAITRFHEAATARVRQLNDISTSIHTAGAQYAATNDEQAQKLASAMGMGAPQSMPVGAHTSTTPGASGPVHSTSVTANANGQSKGIQLVDFKQGGGSQPPDQPGLGQCVVDHVKENVGKEMVRGAFKSAAEKAALGALGGAALTPEVGGAGALPGAVLGWVGGFGQGLIKAPIEAAVKGALECADVPIPKLPKP